MLKFKCKHILEDGILNVGKTTVTFQGENQSSKLWTKSTTIKILMEDVAEIKKVSDKNGIYFITGDGTDYLFINVENLDAAFDAVEKARNLSLSFDLTTQDDEDDDACHEPPKHVRRSSESSIVLSQTKIDKAAFESDKLDGMLEGISDLTYSMKVQRSSDELVKDTSEDRMKSFTKSVRLLSLIGRKKLDPKSGWDTLKKTKDKLISEVALNNVKVKCSFDTFFKQYWSSSAPLPICNYQKNVIKDENINISDWEEGLDGILERTIEYLHPNDAPMGPKMAGSIKDQVLEKYGTFGMVLTTTTTVKDVPMADCFVLMDKIFVEPVGGDEVCISAKIGIKFVKSTMWKSVIQKNAKKGITKWLNGYADFLKS